MTARFYTRDEAAEEARVSHDTIKRAIAKGELRAKRTSRDSDGKGVGKYLISAEALREWFDALADA